MYGSRRTNRESPFEIPVIQLRRLEATASIVDGALPSSRLFTNRNAGVRAAFAASASSLAERSRVAGLGSCVARYGSNCLDRVLVSLSASQQARGRR